jgi:DHA2 family multidrug resistance protein-like MFS transporter
VARDTLGGAVAMALQLNDRRGAELLAAARDAFTQSLELTAAICAAITIVAAVIALALLRRVGAHAERHANLNAAGV